MCTGLGTGIKCVSGGEGPSSLLSVFPTLAHCVTYMEELLPLQHSLIFANVFSQCCLPLISETIKAEFKPRNSLRILSPSGDINFSEF